jgi:hypothetical protein
VPLFRLSSACNATAGNNNTILPYHVLVVAGFEYGRTDQEEKREAIIPLSSVGCDCAAMLRDVT